MNDREEVGQLLEAYRNGDVTWGELTGELLRLATPNLDEFLSEIPQPYLDALVGSWREDFADSTGPWCIVESVCALEQELYLRELAKRETHLNQVVPAIQDWPPRPEFPIELVHP